tara:strand:- start:885 stop:1244 length:360 start_codon:yes stop_codon:yes gene_type:complete
MNHLEAVASRLPTDSARFPGVSARRERTSTRANAPVDEKKKEDSTARVENRAKARDDDRFRAFGRRFGTDSSRVDTRRRGDGHRARVRARGRETGRETGATGGREWIFSNVFRQLVVQL